MTRPASWRLAIVVSAAALSAVAGAQVQQQPARDQPAQRPQFGTGLIAGVVINGQTDQPIADATISLVSAEVVAFRVAQSDRAGRFVLPALPAGRFVLHASKPSYLGAGYGATKAGRPGTVIALADGQQLIGLGLKMWPGAVVTGIVTDEQGEPVTDADVQLQRVGAAPDMLQTMMALGRGSQNTTDDRGVYRVYGLAPGEYVVSASPRGGPPPGTRRMTPEDLAAGQRALREARPVPPKTASVTSPTPMTSTVLPTRPVQAQEDSQAFAPGMGPAPGWAPVYFPGTTDPTRATAISLAMGEERAGINLKIELVPLALVEGTVFGADGAPAANVPILLRREGAAAMESVAALFTGGTAARSGADGRFTVRNAGPGQHTLTARTVGAPGAPSAATLWASAPLTIAGQNITGLVLQLQAGMSLSGRVVMNATRLKPPANLAGVVIAVTAPSTTRDPMSAMLGMAGMGIAGASSAQAARADGTFEVTGLTPGSYLVNGLFRGGEGTGESMLDLLSWRVASVMVDGRDVLDLPIEVKPNADVKDVVVTFTDAQQELSGVITDAGGQPLTASTVVLFAADRRYWYRDSRRVLTARPGTDGRYEFAGPGGPTSGDYFLSVVTDLDPGQQFEPTFLTALAKASPVRVTLAPGEKKTQDLRVGR